MFSRQAKLDPVLETLKGLNGVEQVLQDDWDSAGINVLIFLKIKELRELKPWKLVNPQIKNTIEKALGKQRIGFDFLHWPEIKYLYDSFEGKKVKTGYDCSSVKLVIYV